MLQRLIPDTDVVLVNYRPDVAVKLGVDYEALAGLNPSLIYCENTAFGRQGPDAHRPGYDVMLQAMSGLMAAEGKLDNGAPQHIVSTPMIDTTAGFCLAWCVCAALFARERSGQGQKIETTLLGTALALMGMRFVQVEPLDGERRAGTLESLDAMRGAGMSFQDLLEVYQSQHPQPPGNIYYRTYSTADGAIATGSQGLPDARPLLLASVPSLLPRYGLFNLIGRHASGAAGVGPLDAVVGQLSVETSGDGAIVRGLGVAVRCGLAGSLRVHRIVKAVQEHQDAVVDGEGGYVVRFGNQNVGVRLDGVGAGHHGDVPRQRSRVVRLLNRQPEVPVLAVVLGLFTSGGGARVFVGAKGIGHGSNHYRVRASYHRVEVPIRL